MSFNIFILLFTILCGWLDASVAPRSEWKEAV